MNHKNTIVMGKLFGLICILLAVIGLPITAFGYQSQQYNEFSGGVGNEGLVTYGQMTSSATRTTIPAAHYSGILSSPSSYTVTKYNQVITLDYSRQSKSDLIDADWQVVAILKVENTSSPYQQETCTLTVSTKNFRDIKVFNIPSATWKMSVVSISAYGSINASIKSDISLIPETSIEFYSNDIGTSVLSYPTTPATLIDEELHLAWNEYPYAEEYELQYLFIDYLDQEYTNITTSNAFDHLNPTGAYTEDIHYKEPVNMVLKETDYWLHLTWPKGKLFYRVRPLGRFPDNVEVVKYGQWSSVNSYTTGSTFEGNKLWQSQITYAEDGKHKEVISYLDGSMRGRQSITNLTDGDGNHNNLTMVAETKYNYEGQGVLNILPAVLNDHKITFQSLFNKNAAGSAYSKLDFDKLSNAASSALNTSTGSGHYYSNGVLTDFTGSQYAMMAYIPDAQGYAYSQVEYVRDGTGRVRKTGGVGPDHQLGSGRETKYYYGTTTQTELQRLFGSNVGDASHYKKNLIVDPNGQVSVSYLDQEGRVIATALAGNEPGNLVALPEKQAASINVDLMQRNELDTAGHTSVLRHTILNSVPNTQYSFNYDLQGVINKLGESSTCKSCVYKLKIKLTGSDGNYIALIGGSGGVDSLVITFRGDSIIPNCSLSPSYYTNSSVIFTATLPEIGEYFLSKELTLGDGEVQIFATWAANNLPGWPDSAAIVQNYFDKVDTTICDLTCYGAFKLPCITELSTSVSDWATLTAAEREELIQSCVRSKCNGMINAAIDSTGRSDCESYLLSMKESILPDVNGQLDYHWWQGSTFSTVSFLNPETIEDTTDIVTITQANLSDSTFMRDWMGDSLVTLHREYCQYLACLAQEPAREYTMHLAKTYTVEEAMDTPYLFYNVVVPLSPDSLRKDPFFADSGPWGGAGQRASMYADLTNFKGCGLTLAGYFAFSATPCSATIPNNNIYYLGYSSPADDSLIEARKWQLMRQSYADLRSKYIELVTQANGCNYQTDDQAIVTDPTGNLPQNNADITSFTNQHISLDKAHTCDGNLVAWRLILLNECGISEANFDTYIAPKLYHYCETHYSLANPQGYIFTQDTSSDADLITVKGWLNSIGCSISKISTHNPYAYSADSLWYYNDTSLALSTYEIEQHHQVIVDTQCYVSPCLVSIMDYLNSRTIDYSFWGDCDMASETTGEIDQPTSYCLKTGLYPDADSVRVYMPSTGKLGYLTFGIHDHAETSCHFVITLVDSGGHVFDSVYQVTDLAYDADPIPGYSYVGSGTYEPCGWPYTFSAACTHDFSGVKAKVRRFGSSSLGNAWLYVACYSARGPNSSTTCSSSAPCCPNFIECRRDTIALGYADSTLGAVGQFPYPGYVDTCLAQLYAQAQYFAQQEYEQQYQQVSGSVLASLNRCFLDSFKENFTVSYSLKEYHYTLYYYDQAGNLVQTVPPEGVDVLGDDAFVNGKWVGSSREPHHRLKTRYRHNSLNAVRWQYTPDADSSNFWYDSKGLLKISQNAKQRPHQQYSFTTYDAQGRIVGVGQVAALTTVNANKAMLDEDDFLAYYHPSNTSAYAHSITDYTYTVYDFPLIATNKNPRGRVTNSFRTNSMYDFLNLYTGATIDFSLNSYSYDAHGNVKEYMQLAPNDVISRTVYNYDLLSGKVNKVKYEDDNGSFSHRYSYDADNRLTQVETSRTEINWETDARYYYYPHGPLARIELGNDEVQGLDYYYTIHGWLKGVNNVGDSTLDPGNDGWAYHTRFARDEMAFTLGYYQHDYSPVGSSVPSVTSSSDWAVFSSEIQAAGSPSQLGLFNGNITFMSSSIASHYLDATGHRPFSNGPWQTMVYKYDQLNRIVNSRSYAYMGTSTGFNGAYAENYAYDQNGNIRSLFRNGAEGSLPMDRLGYHYDQEGNGADHWLKSNRLYSFQDTVTSSGYSDDLKKPSTSWSPNNATVNAINNFSYDEIGNLVKDISEEIDSIQWDVYGKIQRLVRVSGSLKPDLLFRYDASGNRVVKVVMPKTTSGALKPYTDWLFTYYMRDASGNVMNTPTTTGFSAWNNEYGIYGSSRLGVYRPIEPGIYKSGNVALGDDYRLVGHKAYELSNHLGNVLVTVSDKKRGFDTNSDDKSDYYLADISSAQDYYPFGMLMPGRIYTSDTYLYGFNGKDQDNEVKGISNSLAYEARIYEVRLGRWLNVDPRESEYAWQSTYAYYMNSPISVVDYLGMGGEADCAVSSEIVDDQIATVDKWQSEIDKTSTYLKQKMAEIVALDKAIETIEGKSILSNFTPIGLGLDAILNWDNIESLRATSDQWKKDYNENLRYLDGAIYLHNQATQTLENTLASSNAIVVSGISGAAAIILHKNSNGYSGSKGIYEIQINGKTYKYGVADMTNMRATPDALTKEVNPSRLQGQINKLREIHGFENVVGRVIESHPDISTFKIKAKETAYIFNYFKKFGEVPTGNIWHRRLVRLWNAITK